MSEVNNLLLEQEEGNRNAILAIGEDLRIMVATKGWVYLKKEIDEQVVSWKDKLVESVDFNESLMIKGMIKAYSSILIRVYSQIEDANLILEEKEGVKQNG